MTVIDLNTVKLLEAYGQCLQEINSWIKYFRNHNVNNNYLIYQSKADQISKPGDDDMSHGYFIHYEEITGLLNTKTIGNFLPLRNDQDSLEWKFLACCVVRGLLHFDVLFDYLLMTEQMDRYPGYYKNQRRFTITDLKAKVSDVVFGATLNSKDQYSYGLAIFLKNKTNQVFNAKLFNSSLGPQFMAYDSVSFNYKAALEIEKAKTFLVSYSLH